MKIYDFLRIQNRDILFMTSPKVKISNLKRKLFKFYIQNIFEFLTSFSSRVTSYSTRLVNISSRAHSSRVRVARELSRLISTPIYNIAMLHVCMCINNLSQPQLMGFFFSSLNFFKF